MYHGYVPRVISLQVIRDGIPQLFIVPLRLRIVLVLLRWAYYFICLIPSRGVSYYSLCRDHRVDSG